jgi:hypothetical protein
MLRTRRAACHRKSPAVLIPIVRLDFASLTDAQLEALCIQVLANGAIVVDYSSNDVDISVHVAATNHSLFYATHSVHCV